MPLSDLWEAALRVTRQPPPVEQAETETNSPLGLEEPRLAAMREWPQQPPIEQAETEEQWVQNPDESGSG